MKKLPLVLLSLLIAFSVAAATPDQNSNANTKSNKTTVKHSPIFRATSDQIKQAQAILKTRSLYTGEQTGKLDKDTRAGLRKYQQAEGLKLTGTLNKLTLVMMGIALTEKQK